MHAPLSQHTYKTLDWLKMMHLLQGLWPTYILRIGPYGFVTLVGADLINLQLNKWRNEGMA
jgi:hypothetical protein